MSSSHYPSPTAWNETIKRRSALKLGAAGAGVVAAGPLLAACGSESTSSSGSVELGNAEGALTVGSNLSDDTPKKAQAAMIAAFPNANVDITINTTDHNTFQENINTILQGGEDDVLTWFAGFRNKFFADQGLLGDISDVWNSVEGLGEGFKTASTGSDGKQYFMPTAYYTWAVNFSKKLWEEKGYEAPTNKDELVALAESMMSDGITPFGFANDGEWPAMGTFDALNLRVNGYDYHNELMAGEHEWTSPEVMNVFSTWEELLPFHQEGANGRTWQEAATDLENGNVGMYLLGTFAASNSEAMAADMDFFNFPELDSKIGASALDAPIDGYQMIADPTNAAAAKELLLHVSTALAQDAYLAVDPSVVASNSGADTSGYSDLQKKSAELANTTEGISQFLDRDTIPDFAGECGSAFAAFIENPGGIGDILADLEEKKVSIFEDFNS